MGAKMSIEEKLWTAGRRGDVAAIRKIGAMPRSAEEQFNLFSWHHPKEGTTALMEAVIAFSNGAAEALLLLGSPVNARHPLTGATPMHFAVGRRGAGTAAAAILLNAGGDVTVRNNRGRTPLDQAREAGHLVMVRYLEQSLAAFAAPVKLYQDGSFASSLGSLFGANIARKATSALGGKWQDAWLVVLNVPTARACGSGIAEVCLYNSVNDVMYKQVMLMQGSAAQVEDAGKRILKLVPRNENAATAASAAAPTAAQWRIQLDGDEPFQVRLESVWWRHRESGDTKKRKGRTVETYWPETPRDRCVDTGRERKREKERERERKREKERERERERVLGADDASKCSVVYGRMRRFNVCDMYSICCSQPHITDQACCTCT